jgi:hypothetical protein
MNKVFVFGFFVFVSQMSTQAFADSREWAEKLEYLARLSPAFKQIYHIQKDTYRTNLKELLEQEGDGSFRLLIDNQQAPHLKLSFIDQFGELQTIPFYLKINMEKVKPWVDGSVLRHLKSTIRGSSDKSFCARPNEEILGKLDHDIVSIIAKNLDWADRSSLKQTNKWINIKVTAAEKGLAGTNRAAIQQEFTLLKDISPLLADIIKLSDGRPSMELINAGRNIRSETLGSFFKELHQSGHLWIKPFRSADGSIRISFYFRDDHDWYTTHEASSSLEEFAQIVADVKQPRLSKLRERVNRGHANL